VRQLRTSKGTQTHLQYHLLACSGCTIVAGSGWGKRGSQRRRTTGKCLAARIRAWGKVCGGCWTRAGGFGFVLLSGGLGSPYRREASASRGGLRPGLSETCFANAQRTKPREHGQTCSEQLDASSRAAVRATLFQTTLVQCVLCLRGSVLLD